MYKFTPSCTPQQVLNWPSLPQLLSSYSTFTCVVVTMRFTQAITLALPAFASAYPGLMGASSRTEMEHMLRAEIEREEVERRDADPQLLNPIGNLVGSIGDVLGGLLNSVGQAIVKATHSRLPALTTPVALALVSTFVPTTDTSLVTAMSTSGRFWTPLHVASTWVRTLLRS
jgi:hypothetical protein